VAAPEAESFFSDSAGGVLARGERPRKRGPKSGDVRDRVVAMVQSVIVFAG